ncbi:hypothetical protein BH09BAC6_BH09BAC6_14850 [soil metagenome]
MEATIKILATKDDLANVKDELKNNIANVKYILGKEISDNIKWMFIFWVGQVAAMLAIVFLFLKK